MHNCPPPTITASAISLFLMAALVLVLGCDPAPQAAAQESETPTITVAELNASLRDPQVVVVDVRQQRSWWRSRKKILNAVREEPARVEQWAAKYPKHKILIFYCS
jgi:uncharacterized lipoprotein YajG